jgi:immune inhibitor A
MPTTVTKRVLQVYTSPHSQNVWGNIETIGWRKVETLSTDGCSNVFQLLVAAKASSLPVTVTISDANLITIIYL